MRIRHVKDIEQKLLEFAHVIIQNPSEHKGKWKLLFGNNHPVHLEIGTGKGKFIRELAYKNANINFVGCELCSSVIYKAAKAAIDLPNLRFINYDAMGLNDCFAENEIEKIYLNFSDPWPKTRHEKRRLTSPIFSSIYERILIRGGIIEFKTDNRRLFEYSVMKFNSAQYEIMDLSLDYHNQEFLREENIITTEYEEKFILLKKVIYYIKVRIK